MSSVPSINAFVAAHTSTSCTASNPVKSDSPSSTTSQPPSNTSVSEDPSKGKKSWLGNIMDKSLGFFGHDGVMFGNFRDHSDTNHLNPEDSNGILSKVRHLSGCSTTSNDELPVSAASIEADRNKNQR